MERSHSPEHIEACLKQLESLPDHEQPVFNHVRRATIELLRALDTEQQFHPNPIMNLAIQEAFARAGLAGTTAIEVAFEDALEALEAAER